MGGWDSVAQFTDQLFEDLRRVDQRRWAHAYVQGLLSTPGKKSIRRLAAAASDSPTASQALHQFINESPWEWAPVCDRLRRWAEERVRPRAWTIAPVVLPKRGEKSCGVHRRFIPHTGRTVNCQIGTAVFMSTEEGEFPVGWSLLLPETWARDPYRERARVPHSAVLSSEAHVLDLMDLLVKHSPHEAVPTVVDLDGYMDVRRLIHGLSRRQRDFVVAVPDSLPLASFHPPAGSGRAPVQSAAQVLGERSAESRLAVGRTGQAPIRDTLVQLPGSPAADQRPQPFRLFAHAAAHAAAPGRLWITNMVQRPVEELTAYAGRHSATGETVDVLQRAFGLRDFEGRSFPGWHHHMTLVSVAFAYSRLAANRGERLAAPGFGGGVESESPPMPPCRPRSLCAPEFSVDRRVAA